MPRLLGDQPFWVRVAYLGFALFSVIIVLYVAASLAIGDSDGLVFGVIIAAVLAVVVFLVTRARPWSYAVAALLTIVGFLFFLPSIPEGLSTPTSFLDFGGTLLGNGGLAIAAVALVMAFLKARSGQPALVGSPAVVRSLQGIVGVLVVLSLVSLVLTFTSIDKVSASDKQGATAVTAKAAKWSTDSLSGTSSGTLKLLVKNSDPYVHTFTVEDLDLDFKLGPGDEKLIVLEKPQAGTYTFKCAVTGHDSMKGTLTIN